MSKIFWVAITVLMAVTSAGAIYQRPQPTPQMDEREDLFRLVIDDYVKETLLKNSSAPSELIFKWQLNLRKVNYPESVQGVSIKVLTRDEIDELCRTQLMNFMYFGWIQVSDSAALVSLCNQMKVSDFDGSLMIGSNGAVIYHCIKLSGEWVVSDREHIWLSRLEFIYD